MSDDAPKPAYSNGFLVSHGASIDSAAPGTGLTGTGRADLDKLYRFASVHFRGCSGPCRALAQDRACAETVSPDDSAVPPRLLKQGSPPNQNTATGRQDSAPGHLDSADQFCYFAVSETKWASAMSLAEVQHRIAAAEDEAGRARGSARLLAVAKLQPLERIRDALSQGHREFGENRVQEALGKWPDLLESHPEIELHLVGPLQSNKVRQAMRLFAAIHSVDRAKLLDRIDAAAQQAGACPRLFIQVNTGEEPQKSGVAPDGLDQLVSDARRLSLPLEGLMCIPPAAEEPALHFGLLANLAKRNGLEGLSMGMSGDFETAVRLGATYVRVGSAVFGARP